ncbi:MAG: tandem-95 repeat protein [Verrucomicrobiales bacterium]|nr:tandem-95 repeat protein [Verrucomicrobiales bacterium]
MGEHRVATVVPPGPEWEGEETLRFIVRDPEGAEDTAIVRFRARAGFRPPEAAPDLVEVAEDAPGIFEVLANDVSPEGRALRIAGVSRPGHGLAELNAQGQVVYQPLPDFTGEDLLEYVLLDDEGGSAVGEIRVRVTPVNDAPRPVADRLILEEDTAGDLDPLLNDEEVDGDALVLVSLQPPAHGRWEPLGGGRYRYSPEAQFSGVETLEYVVRDAWGASATGQVAVLVKPVNDPPVSTPQTVRVNRNRGTDIFYTTEDVDGDPLVFSVLEGPKHGVLLAYSTLAYFDPSPGFVGTDRFTYSVTDGLTTVGPTEVTLVVEARNNPPSVDPVSTVTAVAQQLVIPLRVQDLDDDPVILRVTQEPAQGAVQLDGTNAVYVPAPGFVGTDTFSVAGSDAESEGDPGDVVVRVTDQNTPPRAVSEVLTVARNQATPVMLRATDDENNPLQFELTGQPGIGNLSGTPPRMEYRPPQGFRGLDRLTFVARDAVSTSEVATLHLLVRDPNVLPQTTNQTVVVLKEVGGPVPLTVSDPDGQVLRLALMKGPQSGRVYGRGTALNYRPRPGFEGRDEFTFKVWDGVGYSPEARVTVIVRSREALAPRWGEARVTPSGLVLEGYAEAGVAVRIERSTDLRTWEILGITPNPGGAFQWLDATWSERAGAVYRAVLPLVFEGNPPVFEP